MPGLTKRRIDTLPARDKEYFVWDDQLKGFGVRVYPNGGKRIPAAALHRRAPVRDTDPEMGVHPGQPHPPSRFENGAKTIPLNGPALEVLAGAQRVDGNPYVIVGAAEGSHLTDLQKPWRRVRKAAGLDDVRIHDLRHTFASEAVMGGESLPMVGKILGHAQTQTTARYAHLADDPLQNASERIATSLKQAMGR